MDRVSIHSVAQMREQARRYLPRMIFDFVDGGAERELTLRANLEDFEAVRFRPRTLVDVGHVDLSTQVLGERIERPLMIAPMGLCGVVRPQGELALARAAARAGMPFVLSTAASYSIEEVAEAAPGKLWFQLYLFRDPGLRGAFVERAREAGYRALVVTVDLARGGKREKDLRNGFTVPVRWRPHNAIDFATHPRWALRMLPHRDMTLGNLKGFGAGGDDVMALSTFMNTQIDPSVSWNDLESLRAQWDLPLLVKGVLSPEDASRAVELGADGIIISNHGGRQLDGAPSTISALPAIADAVGGRADLILDGGIRRGADVVKALALGARACMIGKAALYGLAAGGEAGVDQVIDLLSREIDVAMALSGRARTDDLDRQAVRVPGEWFEDA